VVAFKDMLANQVIWFADRDLVEDTGSRHRRLDYLVFICKHALRPVACTCPR
jgi:hypothetical protein